MHYEEQQIKDIKIHVQPKPNRGNMYFFCKEENNPGAPFCLCKVRFALTCQF